ncbi:hypothetical protein TBLA_0I03240 [Henningerozyma blattae CBS 6284]|uniref:Acyl-coenzyme A oxidase n=1 Tax=Henningerozyma blattae (strain ATCC 34711 / CBS 6284 / DSM 70876 / NBRC 10599 / NRRL Y-10934 / UCD 77-7) TaxID=1071380 RepID=I2H9C7_HENB6|nr:hypothetical protein TBLA_0I03240 [Tetrapisispora blattae CBS 6284]CCH62979.1 hypothetical protein TBLA_0I03240 [Tetrapisispora blattae CBS 6284]
MTRGSTVNPDSPVFNPKKFLATERDNSKINITQLNHFLESTPENSRLVRSLIDQIVNDPILKTQTNYYDNEILKEREQTLKKIARLSLYMEQDIKTVRHSFRNKDLLKSLQDEQENANTLTNKDISIFDKRLSLIAMIDPQLSTRVGVHLGLFGNCIKGNGTDEQIKYWLQTKGALFIKGIYGCFAMTELGHGSNVAQMQTTATYNPEDDTFIINTPNLTATKWWIGGAAHSATHSVAYCRLIVNGKDYGVKTFVVPLRNITTFDLLPGISIGDLGKKMGRDGIDNGWIQYKNVVIPREYMLSRFTKVVKDPQTGVPTVKTQPQLDQISGYSALLSGRVNMVMDSFRFGSRFTTIATRYAVGRQQFANTKDSPETQLINYPLHQYRLIPQIAITYLISPVAFDLLDNYYTTLEELYTASSNKSSSASLDLVSKKLKNLFVDSAALKATNTWLVAQLIDELRQSCGGHGYSQYNGFGKGYNDWVVQCTWEGDNNILSLTAAKSIVKKFVDAALKGKYNSSLDEHSFDYLNPTNIMKIMSTSSSPYFEFKEGGGEDDNQDYRTIWGVMLVKLIAHIAKQIRKTNDPDMMSKSLVMVSKFHSIQLMLKCFETKLNNKKTSDPKTREILWKLYKLFSLYFIDKHSGEFQQFKILKPDQVTNVIQKKLLQLLPEIRTECIALTDAFKLPDEVLNAPIGYYDGDIYQNYFNEIIQNNPVEKTEAGKPPYVDLLLKTLHRGYTFDEALGGSSDSSILEKLSK